MPSRRQKPQSWWEVKPIDASWTYKRKRPRKGPARSRGSSRRSSKIDSTTVFVVLGLVLVLTLLQFVSENPEIALPIFGLALFAVYHIWRFRRRRDAAARRAEVLSRKTLGDYLILTPAEFEVAVARLLEHLGYRDVERTGKSGDLNADIRCRDTEGRSIVVQCKRHAPGIAVGSEKVQTFIGMMSVHHVADRGIFVTTSHFTQPARGLAQQHGIQLIDGDELIRLTKQLEASSDSRDAV